MTSFSKVALKNERKYQHQQHWKFNWDSIKWCPMTRIPMINLNSNFQLSSSSRSTDKLHWLSCIWHPLKCKGKSFLSKVHGMILNILFCFWDFYWYITTHSSDQAWSRIEFGNLYHYLDWSNQPLYPLSSFLTISEGRCPLKKWTLTCKNVVLLDVLTDLLL